MKANSVSDKKVLKRTSVLKPKYHSTAVCCIKMRVAGYQKVRQTLSYDLIKLFPDFSLPLNAITDISFNVKDSGQ
jgi:hypothetical protein